MGKLCIITPMKKVFWILTILGFFCAPLFAQERYIIFFAETAEVPQAVALKILDSKRFCMVVPFDTGEKISAIADELLSKGKFEPALSFNPEPLFPVLAEVYGTSGKSSGFSDYVNTNFTDFSTNLNRDRFGIFLKSGILSNDVLYYFAGLKLPWINIQNNITGFYQVSGVPSYALYTDFPTSQSEIMSWLEKRKDAVIPVLLTKKHLSNTALMNYIIGLFDSSVYIKPAVPMYIYAINITAPKRTINFEKPEITPNLLEKLNLAASAINKYKSSSKFNEIFYQNAQDELSFLTGADLLAGASKEDISSARLFDATYNNVFRLLGFPIPGGDSITSKQPSTSASVASTLKISKTAGGIVITDDAAPVIKAVSIVTSGDSIKVDIIADWEDTSFIDLYIDMNNIEWAGSTAMMSGINGFLNADSGWEYAVRVRDTKAFLYRYSSSDGAELLAELPVHEGSFSMPQKFISGNPANWGYQAVSLSKSQSAISDFLNNSSKSRQEVLSKRPFQVPSVRVK